MLVQCLWGNCQLGFDACLENVFCAIPHEERPTHIVCYVVGRPKSRGHLTLTQFRAGGTRLLGRHGHQHQDGGQHGNRGGGALGVGDRGHVILRGRGRGRRQGGVGGREDKR